MFADDFCPVWSSQAVLMNEDHRWFCGGTILNQYIILTAAHCMNETRYFYIKLGKDRYSGVDTHACSGLAVFCWLVYFQITPSMAFFQASLTCWWMMAMKLSMKWRL